MSDISKLVMLIEKSYQNNVASAQKGKEILGCIYAREALETMVDFLNCGYPLESKDVDPGKKYFIDKMKDQRTEILDKTDAYVCEDKTFNFEIIEYVFGRYYCLDLGAISLYGKGVLKIYSDSETVVFKFAEITKTFRLINLAGADLEKTLELIVQFIFDCLSQI